MAVPRGPAAAQRSEHEPRYYVTMGRPVRIGCSCSWYPPKPPVRMSMMHVAFMRHRQKFNLHPRQGYGSIRYADGPYKGMTWDEAYALDEAKQLEPRTA